LYFEKGGELKLLKEINEFLKNIIFIPNKWRIYFLNRKIYLCVVILLNLYNININISNICFRFKKREKGGSLK
jgi:hypothetical protein